MIASRDEFSTSRSGHSVSIEQCGKISTAIPKVLVLTGDDDNLIHPVRSKELHNLLPGSEYIRIEGGGHALVRPIVEASIASLSVRSRRSATPRSTRS
jgi:PhoPQ-activated pathogenicity-related protein